MKQQTAVEWLYENILLTPLDIRSINKCLEQAKAMEAKEKLKHQLFIGKVTEILGFDKTVELLKECNNEIL
jgi:hypothetical protein